MATTPLRLGALFSHPIQYFAPLFRELSSRRDIDLTVYYCSRGGLDPTYDPGFGRTVQWDVPLLDGYRSRFLPNCSPRPEGSSFWKLVNPSVIQELRRERYDAILIHGYNYATHWLAVLAARLSGTAILLRGEATLIDSRPVATRLAKEAILRPLIAAARACLYIGSPHRLFYEHYGARCSRLFFSPYSVDDSFFRQDRSAWECRRLETRHRLGIAEGTPLVIAPAKIIPKKQPLLLLEAFERVRRECSCALLFVGDGNLRAEVESRCKKLGLTDVHITGFMNQREMLTAYAAADIMVLPSAREPWGLVVNEAMNSGLPVIVSNRVGCSRDLVYPGQNGYVVPWDDMGALAQSLMSLVQDPNKCRRFGQRSLEVVEGYSLKRTADGIMAACHAV